MTKNRLFIFQNITSLEAKFILHIIQTKFKTHNIEEKNKKLAIMKSSHRGKIVQIQQEYMDFLFPEVKDHTS